MTQTETLGLKQVFALGKRKQKLITTLKTHTLGVSTSTCKNPKPKPSRNTSSWRRQPPQKATNRFIQAAPSERQLHWTPWLNSLRLSIENLPRKLLGPGSRNHIWLKIRQTSSESQTTLAKWKTNSNHQKNWWNKSLHWIKHGSKRFNKCVFLLFSFWDSKFVSRQVWGFTSHASEVSSWLRMICFQFESISSLHRQLETLLNLKGKSSHIYQDCWINFPGVSWRQKEFIFSRLSPGLGRISCCKGSWSFVQSSWLAKLSA